MATARFVMDMAADHAAFQRDLSQAERAVDATATKMGTSFGRVQTSVGHVTAGLGVLKGVLAGVLGVAGITGLATQAIQAGDALQDMSSRIGINVEALQELQHGARMSGASAEELETGLRHLSRRIGEAAAGEAEASKLVQGAGPGRLGPRLARSPPPRTCWPSSPIASRRCRPRPSVPALPWSCWGVAERP